MSNELLQVDNPNPFQMNIKNKFGFTIWEQMYFTSTVLKKVIQMGLPKKECGINNVFIDSINQLFDRCEYCIKNCGFKCKSK